MTKVEELLDLLDEYIDARTLNAIWRNEGVDESVKHEREARLKLLRFIGLNVELR